jgi:hypothetical protein
MNKSPSRIVHPIEVHIIQLLNNIDIAGRILQGRGRQRTLVEVLIMAHAKKNKKKKLLCLSERCSPVLELVR